MAVMPTKWLGNKSIAVPLRKDYSHDVEAMIKADPNAGAYYICNPNNPTGTLTPRKDFEYILANKPKDAVLIIDEAYVHFSGPENMSTDLVKDGQGCDCSAHLLKDLWHGRSARRSGLRASRSAGQSQPVWWHGFMPVTATACAAASMKVGPSLMKERLAINKKNRELAFEFLQKKGVTIHPFRHQLLHDGSEGHDRSAGGNRNADAQGPDRPGMARMAGDGSRDGGHLRRNG